MFCRKDAVVWFFCAVVSVSFFHLFVKGLLWHTLLFSWFSVFVGFWDFNLAVLAVCVSKHHGAAVAQWSVLRSPHLEAVGLSLSCVIKKIRCETKVKQQPSAKIKNVQNTTFSSFRRPKHQLLVFKFCLLFYKIHGDPFLKHCSLSNLIQLLARLLFLCNV